PGARAARRAALGAGAGRGSAGTRRRRAGVRGPGRGGDRERPGPGRPSTARQPAGARPAPARPAGAAAAARSRRRERPASAPRPPTLGRLELVSHGDHLRQAADSLERAPSATQRELRAHTLGTTFRALANAGGGVLADRVAQFAIAAREAVASGVAVTSPAA